jgi:hypothetical protein
MTDREQQRNALMAMLGELPYLRAQLEARAGSGELAETLANEMKAALVEGFKSKPKRLKRIANWLLVIWRAAHDTAGAPGE